MAGVLAVRTRATPRVTFAMVETEDGRVLIAGDQTIPAQYEDRRFSNGMEPHQQLNASSTIDAFNYLVIPG